jgi:hypothetical protein
MEELVSLYATATGTINARPAVGMTFEPQGHPTAAENQHYMVIAKVPARVR